MARTKRYNKPKKKVKIRNWHAVNAHFRRSGALEGNPSKKASKEECRKWKHKGGRDAED